MVHNLVYYLEYIQLANFKTVSLIILWKGKLENIYFINSSIKKSVSHYHNSIGNEEMNESIIIKKIKY